MSYRSFFTILTSETPVEVYEAQPGDVEIWIHTNGTAPTYIGGASGTYTRITATSLNNATPLPVRSGEVFFASRVGTVNDTVRFFVRSV